MINLYRRDPDLDELDSERLGCATGILWAVKIATYAIGVCWLVVGLAILAARIAEALR